MKRLAKILLGMDSATSAFGEMYEGPIKIYPSDNSPPYEDGDARYYKAEVGYLFERSGKTKQDMPTLTISIPLDKIIK